VFNSTVAHGNNIYLPIQRINTINFKLTQLNLNLMKNNKAVQFTKG